MKMRVVIVLAFAIATLAVTAHAAEWKWQHFGAAPYATSRDEAMSKRHDAFQKLGLTHKVIDELMRATEKPGEKIRLVNGYKLAAMLSKGGVVHNDVLVAFVKPPISGKMEYAAPAERWQVPVEGKIYTVILPEICNNWSSEPTKPAPVPLPPPCDNCAAPPPPKDNCVTISFNAPIGGKVRWGVASAIGPLPPSSCNAQKQGNGEWTAWYGQCDSCTGAIEFIRGIIGRFAEIFHRFVYPVTQTHQTLRFPEAVKADVVYICLEDANGRQTYGVYVTPDDWSHGEVVHEISDFRWKFVGYPE